MRILNVLAQKPDSTGSGTYLAQTVAAEFALGHQTAVVCGINAADKIESLPEQTAVYPVRFLGAELPFPVCGMSDQMPYPSTRYRDLTPSMVEQYESAFIGTVGQALGEFKPDVIVCHHLYLACALTVELAGTTPVVAVCHSTDIRQMRTHELERSRILAAMQRLRRVFALHEAQATEIAECYQLDRERISVLGVGYDSAVFYRPGECAKACSHGESNAQAEGHACDEPSRAKHSLVFVGKVNEKKGALSLLRAVALLEEQGVAPRGLRITLVGGHDANTPDYERICAFARTLQSPVEFAGRLNPEQLAQVYRRSELFVLPSFFEGLPLVGIEALACGCKVLMTDLPGVAQGYAALVPHNPIRYVALPRMATLDTPDPADLPNFEARLAHALATAFAEPVASCNTSQASWLALGNRLLSGLDEVLHAR